MLARGETTRNSNETRNPGFNADFQVPVKCPWKWRSNACNNQVGYEQLHPAVTCYAGILSPAQKRWLPTTERRVKFRWEEHFTVGGEAGIGKKDQLTSDHSAFTLCSVPERNTRSQFWRFVTLKGEDAEPALCWFCGQLFEVSPFFS